MGKYPFIFPNGIIINDFPKNTLFNQFNQQYKNILYGYRKKTSRNLE